MKHDVALKVAEGLVGHLRPACVRIEIAGSIRREKPEVKDIELVCVPDLMVTPRRAPLEFGKPAPPSYKTELDRLIAEMGEDVRLEANGARMKKLDLRYAGIKVDVFVVLPPAQWGPLLTIRTGPADFSHWCVTRRKHGGALPNWFFVKHGCVWDEREISKREVGENPDKAAALMREGNHIEQPEEIHFLNLLELGWIEPRERFAEWR